jgi:hypothetical protein
MRQLVWTGNQLVARVGHKPLQRGQGGVELHHGAGDYTFQLVQPSRVHPVFGQLGQACLDRLSFMRPAPGPRLWLGPPPLTRESSLALGPDWTQFETLGADIPRPKGPGLGYAVVIDTGTWPTLSLYKDWFLLVNQILSDGGVYLFARLGPSSLRDLKGALERAGLRADDLLPEAMIASWADLHDLGDGLQQAGLVSPVMESDSLRFSYQTLRQLVRDLRAWPDRKAHKATNQALKSPRLGAKALQVVFEALCREDLAGLVVDWEMVVGHAWKPVLPQETDQNDKRPGLSPLRFFRKKP